MKYIYISLFFILLSTCGISLRATCQQFNTFNLNIDNGLPSNHVYGIIKDHYGYLWICTEKGVVRYNGYETKLFDLSSGLPTEDVWQLFEDKKGRIWCSSISDDIGFIYNNKYHSAFLVNHKGTVYPSTLNDLNNGVAFSTSVHGISSFCYEHNDSIAFQTINESIFNTPIAKITVDMLPIQNQNNSGEVFFLSGSNIFKISLIKNKVVGKIFVELDSESTSKIVGRGAILLGNHIIFFSSGLSSVFNLLDTSDSKLYDIDIHKFGISKNINYIHPDITNKKFYVITDDYALEFDYKNKVEYVRTIRISDLQLNTKVDGSKIFTIRNDLFWGNFIGTANCGLFLHYNLKNNFRPIKLPDNYKIIERSSDTALYMWNSSENILAELGSGLNITLTKNQNFNDKPKSVFPYNKDTFLLSGLDNYFLDKHSGQIKKTFSTSTPFSMIVNQPGELFMITTGGFVNEKYIIDSGFRLTTYDRNRYKELAYDPIRENILAYNFDNVFIYNARNKTDTLISKSKLSEFGVKRVEKILVDNRYGNIFFKGHENLTIYDYELKSYHELFEKFNLKDASIFIHNNTLIVPGRFGILFSKILGRGKMSQPLLYSNIKNINYSRIYNCKILRDRLVLLTDKGNYEVLIPGDNEISNATATQSQYKFIVNYRDTIFNSNSGDTITIKQPYTRLQFDVINPIGTGHLKYSYKLSDDSDWHELNANELTLPHLTPDKYYDLSIIFNDDALKSDRIKLHLYITPYWWQTNSGRRIMGTTIALAVILLFGTSVIITRKLVINASKKRNLRMELELKAIYAQINPHFIFNTLNSALLLVSKNKMDEAYTHISKFSRLLRSYIKSSRNKLITIEEEIANLRDYLELQQTRFKNKFEYQIKVDNKIVPQRIKIPSLLLQPFVENAINHGLLQKEETGHLTIEFKISELKNEIVCTIEDDGIGRKVSKVLNEGVPGKNESYGDLLIKDLVSIFNKYENMNIEIEYKDKEEPLTGTIVTIYIKHPNYEQQH